MAQLASAVLGDEQQPVRAPGHLQLAGEHPYLLALYRH